MSNKEFLEEWILCLFDGYGKDMYEFREAYDFDGREYSYLAFFFRNYFDRFVYSMYSPDCVGWENPPKNIHEVVMDVGHSDMLILFEDV